MAWTSMHFAVGMACSGAATGAVCLFLKRGWRWLPAAMTVGGAWALAPDSPRIFREDFTFLPFAATLGDKGLELWLHSIGNVFFFHRALDAQPREFALHGFALVLLLYNLSLVMLMVMEHRQRHSFGNLAWRARKGRLRHRRTGPRVLEAADDPNSPVVARFRSSHLNRTA